MKTKPWAVRSWSEWRWTHTAPGDALAGTVGFGCAASAFYLPGVPLSLALLALVAAGLAPIHRRFAIILGWHIAAASPAMIGLWNLGGGATPLILLAVWLCITTMTFTVLGPGIGTLISLAFPWHIGSAALAAGELWPGTQEVGLVLIPAMLCGLCTRRRTWRVATLMSVVVISFCAWMAWDPIKADGLLEVKLDTQPAMITRSYEKALIAQLPANGTVMLGENILDLEDQTALSRWCRYAAELQSELFVGTLERSNRATIRHFAPDDCRGKVVYERRFGLPGIPGGTGIGTGQMQDVRIRRRSIHWLICFEAFVPLAWTAMDASPGSVAVIVANDRWTRPAPVDVARRKVVRSMARLWSLTPVLAETGRSVVVERWPLMRQVGMPPLRKVENTIAKRPGP